MSDHRGNEDQLAKQLEALHEKVKQDATGSQHDASPPDPEALPSDSSLIESERLLQMLHMLKGFSTRDTAREPRETLPTEVAEPARTEPVAPLLADRPPGKIGRFEVIEPVGQGGFGIVFRAHDPVLGRDVAVKVPKLDAMITEDARQRFLRESQAAAALAHPNIVTVYESNHLGPVCYLACEFIEGPTLAQWMKQQGAPVAPDSAARLIVKLADALQHAHSRGIVHRDIKPGNVLLDASSAEISAQDLASSAKIGDFGLAKLANAESSKTKTGFLVGTPAYMAPEQVRGASAEVGPPTDVYALGLLLYELLTGTNPFVSDTVVQTMKQVQETDPAAPSRSNRSVSADLDSIVLKCLEKSPTLRYSTAADLRDDLERFLNREPVRARRITGFTRAVKWVKHNQLVSILMLLLVAGMLGTTLGLLRARQAEKDARLANQATQAALGQARESETRAKNAAELAAVEANTANEVSRFLEDLFDASNTLGSNPGETRGKDLTAEQLLIHGAEKIKSELEDQPKVKARLMTKIGSILTKYGNLDEAERLLQEALTLRVELLDPDDAELAVSHRWLGVLFREKQEFENAKHHLNTALEILSSDIKSNHRHLAGTYNDLGILLAEREPNESRRNYEQALALAIEYRPGEDIAWGLQANLAALDYRAGKMDKAIAGFEQALQLGRQAHGGEMHPTMATIIGNLAFLYRKQGNLERALELQTAELQLLEAELGPEHRKVGVGLMNLAAIYQQQGLLGKAESSAQRSLKILQDELPADHSYIQVARSHYVTSLIRLRQFGKARLALEPSLQAVKDDDPAKKRIWWGTRILLAQIERLDGNATAAAEIIDEVLGSEFVKTESKLWVDANVLYALIVAQQKSDSAESVLKRVESIVDEMGNLAAPDRLFFQAQFWSLKGNSDIALSKLADAIAAGFNDSAVFTLPDFDSLRTEPQYGEIVAPLSKRFPNL